MQEEVTQGAVTLIINGAKISEQTLEKAIQKFLDEQKQGKLPKIHRGKQTLKQLAGQNAGLASIEITDKNIRSFSSVAKKYHIDFALKRDKMADQPRYLVFFKSRDADAVTAAFREFTDRKLHKPSVRKQLEQARARLAAMVKQAPEKIKNRELER